MALHRHNDIAAAKYHVWGIVKRLDVGVKTHFGGMSNLRRKTNTVVSNLASVLA